MADAEAAGVFVYKTVAQGAATTLVAAIAPAFAHTGGHYLTDGQEARTVPNDADLFDNSDGAKQWALDPDTARTLWRPSKTGGGHSGYASDGRKPRSSSGASDGVVAVTLTASCRTS